MKVFLTLLLACLATLEARADEHPQIVRDGVPVTARPGAAFANNVVRLLASCDVDSTSYVVTSDTWAQALRSPTRVLLRLGPAGQTIQIDAGIALKVDEILLPLPEATYPAHVFVKAANVVRAFTKYSPESLLAIGLEPALGVATRRPYPELDKHDWVREKAAAGR